MTIYPNVGALKLFEALQLVMQVAELRLYKTILAPMSVNTVLTDFTEANFSGYAAADIAAFLATYLDPAGGGSMQSGTQQFTFDGADLTPTTNVVYGWYLVDSGPSLIACGTFPAPIAMQAAGDAIPLNVILNAFRN